MQTNRVSDIQRLVDGGYQIRIPGGTNRGDDTSFACFGAIVRKTIRAHHSYFEIVVVPYMPKNIPTESIEQSFSETKEGTLEREIIEETGILAKVYYEIAQMSIPDNSSQNNMHIKYAFLIEDYDASNIRCNLSASQPELGIPLWIPLNLLEKYIFEGHRWILAPLKEYLGYFGKKIPTHHPSKRFIEAS